MTVSKERVLEVIRERGPIRAGEVAEVLREHIYGTIIFRLRELRDEGLVERFPDLMDMRRHFYRAREEE